MSKKIRILIISLCLALVIAVSFCVALLSGGAAENSIIRLVSFDYIENTLLGYIDDNDKVAQNDITVLKGQLLAAEKEIDHLKEQLGQGGEYESITLLRGQTLEVKTGCEFIVTLGRMEILSGNICDVTEGIVLEAEQNLERAHSLVASCDSVVTVSTGEVTILIRGEYKNG